MKKKLIIGGIMALCIVSFVNAKMKFYSDWRKGYNGYGEAFYVGTTEKTNPKELADNLDEMVKVAGYSMAYHCQKLTNQQTFLIRSALNEYDFADGEIYTVQIQEGTNQYIFIVVIEDKKSSFEWYIGICFPQF